ncbi:MAG: Uma2 family endonuclease [Pseudanabaena sp.]|jgi:Uma2 family endonuclease
MTITAIRKLTFEEYLTYDDGTDKRYEFNDGELVELSPPIGLHERIVTFLLVFLSVTFKQQSSPYCVRANGVEIWTGKRTRRPDVCVLSKQQELDILKKAAILFSPPLLVIEVVSPDYRNVDRQDKWSEYQSIGVLEYWIVDAGLGLISIFYLVNGVYQETIFHLGEQIISPTFMNLQLTVDDVLNADI